MEIALAVLLVSSFTSVGLLSLWAATLRRHWLLRTSVFVAALSLLLLIPAYGPLAALAWQGCVIVVCMRIVRWTKGSDSIKPYQFSLATLLRLMTLTAVVLTVAMKVDFEAFDPYASETVFCIGLGGGMATLIGYWMVRGRAIRLWLRIAAGLTSSVLLALFFGSGDWFVISLIKNFQGYPDNFSAVAERISKGPEGGFFGIEEFFIWGTVGIGIVALTALFIGLVANLVLVTQQNRQRRTLISVLVFAVILLSPLIVISYQLMTPLPIPVQKLPIDNGYDNLLAASKIIDDEVFGWTFDYEEFSNEKLRTNIEEASSAYEQVKIALTKEIQVSIDYRSFDTYLSGLMFDIQSVSRGLAARGLLATREGRIEAALQDYLDVLRIGNAVRQQALDSHWIGGGIMINGSGYSGIYHLRYELDREQINEICTLLQLLESKWDSQEEISYRTRILKQRVSGWFGHLTQILSGFNSLEETSSILMHERTQSHLLCAELAVLAFRLEHGHLPERLEELVPEYLPEVPSDPCSPNGDLLQYRRESETFVLYSVGDNGVDDGGIPKRGKNWEFGDLLLNDLFAPKTPAVVTEDE